MKSTSFGREFVESVHVAWRPLSCLLCQCVCNCVCVCVWDLHVLPCLFTFCLVEADRFDWYLQWKKDGSWEVKEERWLEAGRVLWRSGGGGVQVMHLFVIFCRWFITGERQRRCSLMVQDLMAACFSILHSQHLTQATFRLFIFYRHFFSSKILHWLPLRPTASTEATALCSDQRSTTSSLNVPKAFRAAVHVELISQPVRKSVCFCLHADKNTLGSIWNESFKHLSLRKSIVNTLQ